MKIRVITMVCALLLALPSFAQEEKKSPPKSPAAEELKALVGKVSEKIKEKEGKPTAADLESSLREFDALLEKYKGEKTDDVAEILRMKAMLYLQVLDDSKKGTELIEKLKSDYPETRAGKSADRILESIKRQAESKKIQESLKEGTVFPDFQEKDLDGKALSIADYKGKVLLVDFWATWCGPCVAELPNVLKAYEKHHAAGFEILGISLDQSEEKLRAFIKEKNMPWRQYFDGKGWESKLGGKYGVNSIPATYLLDKEGKIIAKNLRGEALEEAVAKALEKK